MIWPENRNLHFFAIVIVALYVYLLHIMQKLLTWLILEMYHSSRGAILKQLTKRFAALSMVLFAIVNLQRNRV